MEKHIFFAAPLVLLFLSLLHPCLAGTYQSVVIGEVSQRDADHPIFEINFPPLGERTAKGDPGQKAPGMKTMRVVTARGQAMRCVLPKPAKATAPPPPLNEETVFDDIDDLLAEYEGKCFIRLDGWWTYEFCYGDKIVQKHNIPKERAPYDGEVEDSYVLGAFDRELDLERRKNVSLVTTHDSAFTQAFVNGTVCDTTEKPRRVLVKYLCSDDAVRLLNNARKSRQRDLNILKTVREVESCVYEVEFMGSAICKHPKYIERLANAARPIHCSMETDERPFEGLSSWSYKKASLNL